MVVELNRTTAPKNSTDGSICSANHSKLVISWPKEKYYVLKMEFMREFGASESWKVSSVMLNVTLKGNKAFHNPTGELKNFNSTSPSIKLISLFPGHLTFLTEVVGSC